MKINSQHFRVLPGKKAALSEWPTIVKPFCKSEKQYRKALGAHVEELSSLQQLHYASNRYALLLIFQGMDAGGKDGAIRHVMSGVDPQRCQVFSFNSRAPANWSMIFSGGPRAGFLNAGISAYSIVPIARKSLPSGCIRRFSAPKGCRKSCATRKRSGTSAIAPSWTSRTISIATERAQSKLFLHLSRDEQRKRFLERNDEPGKNWKFSLADIHERKYWKDHMKAYEACLSATSTHHAPWYAVPADDKENARLIVSQIVLDALNELKMTYPKTTEKRKQELGSIRKKQTK